MKTCISFSINLSQIVLTKGFQDPEIKLCEEIS